MMPRTLSVYSSFYSVVISTSHLASERKRPSLFHILCRIPVYRGPVSASIEYGAGKFPLRTSSSTRWERERYHIIPGLEIYGCDLLIGARH